MGLCPKFKRHRKAMKLHRHSSPTGSWYTFRKNLFKWKGQKVMVLQFCSVCVFSPSNYLGAPRPDIPNDMFTSKSRPGHVANFTMISKGYPYPNYTWTHNGEELPRQMQFNDGSYSYVNFTSVEIADFGNYTLTMTNFLGTYVASYQLVPYGEFHANQK